MVSANGLEDLIAVAPQTGTASLQTHAFFGIFHDFCRVVFVTYAGT